MTPPTTSAVASGIAYTVVVERSGGTKRVGGGAAARAAAFGTVTCRSAEDPLASWTPSRFGRMEMIRYVLIQWRLLG